MNEKQKKPRVKRDTISRERARQIQMSGLGEMRRILFAKGYSAEDFFDVKPSKRTNKC